MRIRDQPFDIAGKKKGSCESERVHTRIYTSEEIERVYLFEYTRRVGTLLRIALDFDFIISLCQYGPRHRLGAALGRTGIRLS